MSSEERKHRSHLPIPTPERIGLIDSGAPVSQDYGSRGNAFNGTVNGAQFAIGGAAKSADHLVSPQKAIRIAMARQ